MTQVSGAKTAHVAKSSKGTVPATRMAEPIVEAEPTTEQIRQRAYELYLFRGAGPGDALEDWLEAERELRNKHS
jgi:Protein of unknown function (DUF2934)